MIWIVHQFVPSLSCVQIGVVRTADSYNLEVMNWQCQNCHVVESMEMGLFCGASRADFRVIFTFQWENFMRSHIYYMDFMPEMYLKSNSMFFLFCSAYSPGGILSLAVWVVFFFFLFFFKCFFLLQMVYSKYCQTYLIQCGKSKTTQVLTNLQLYKSVFHPQRNFLFEKDISCTIITPFDLILCLVFFFFSDKGGQQFLSYNFRNADSYHVLCDMQFIIQLWITTMSLYESFYSLSFPGWPSFYNT